MFNQLSSYFSRGRDSDVVRAEHSYSKPWSTHPDANRSRPIRKLLVRVEADEGGRRDSDGEVDVETCKDREHSFPNIYDLKRARNVMDECETHSDLVNRKKLGDDWSELLDKDGWTAAQHTLFDKIITILEGDVVARLAYAGDVSEPLMRRLYNDKTAKRVRRVLGDIAWEESLCQWLHSTLSDNLSSQLLGVYLDVLQVLRSKVPSLVDMMTSSSVSAAPATSEALALLLKRPWDPAIALTVQSKQRKLTGSPFLVLVPSTPMSPSLPSTRRSRAWHNQLSTLGRVVPVTVSSSVYHEGSGVSADVCAEKMIYVTRCKVQELQGHFNTRPVVLIGWGAGALVACKVSQMEDVTAVVCLGFPSRGLGGKQDTIEDMLLELTTPTFFVVGSDAVNCDVSRLDELRERMKVENSMTVVNGADDQLRVNWEKKKIEGVTQTVVDRCLQEEIGEFLCYTLTLATYRAIIDVDTIEVSRSTRTRRKPRTVSLDSKSYTPTNTRHDALQSSAKRHKESPSVKSLTALPPRTDTPVTMAGTPPQHTGQNVLTPFTFKPSPPLTVVSSATQSLIRVTMAGQVHSTKTPQFAGGGGTVRPQHTPVHMATQLASKGVGVVNRAQPMYSGSGGVTKPRDLSHVYVPSLASQMPASTSSPAVSKATTLSIAAASSTSSPVVTSTTTAQPSVSSSCHAVGIRNERAFQYHQVNPGPSVVPTSASVEKAGMKILNGESGRLAAAGGKDGGKDVKPEEKESEKKASVAKVVVDEREKGKDADDADRTDDEDDDKFFRY